MFQVQKNTFNLRYFQKSVNNMGLETLSYCAPQLWNMVPAKIRQSPSLSAFKEKINT